MGIHSATTALASGSQIILFVQLAGEFLSGTLVRNSAVEGAITVAGE